ncbi:GCN5-related N-acetyltransferase OS=Tsukamurella paurometabola (strain ATCC 8368 / DSM / CCUG 35730 / CIP 100753 / JCM 10117 / KCTC 9821 / NBRC 16120 /NCIMB 702349 / NCTC 13040) OX=521096 GN=Tpau_1072 PE=4 SV=1 [Tsukamurella paurometabola]|uniref:GCN5-related N-acetyltransferase n=2 Tax=Tsukamurella paurometabola TaxID=2061 RepID=D5UVB4_TSUPD|nr:GCN5-related N-acetyltransferase [Tsukamurella paurometabola DSM 20162]SUP28383.1 Acetyltransferase (GNAT) family [Tsukamurella paurometabola]
MNLIPSAPPMADYLRLRADSGLSPRTAAQAEGALANSWRWCHAMVDGEVVAMGRILGDGGWYFHIADMATLPAFQGRGIGRAILEWLLAEIRTHAPEDPYITLMADEPGRPLYRRLGFVETAPRSLGMWLPG